MKRLLLFSLPLILIGCARSNIIINKEAFTIDSPDEKGNVIIEGKLSYYKPTKNIIRYEIVNKKTREKVVGDMQPDDKLSREIQASENDNIKLTFNDREGNYAKHTMKVSQMLPLSESEGSAKKDIANSKFVSEHLNNAISLADKGDYDSALRECILVREKEPMNSDLNILLAWVMLQKESLAKVEEFVQLALNYEKDISKKAACWSLKAQTLMKLGRKEEAKEAIKTSVKYLSKDKSLWGIQEGYRLDQRLKPNIYQFTLCNDALLYMRLDEPSDAFELFKQYFKLVNPQNDAEAARFYAFLAITQSQDIERDGIINEYINLPSAPQIKYGCFMLSKGYDGLTMLKQQSPLPASEEQKILRRRIVSYWYMVNNEYGKVAELAYQNLMNEGPLNIEDSICYSRAWDHTKDKTSFRSQLDNLLEKHPGESLFQSLDGDYYLSSGDYPKAEAIYKIILEKDPNDSWSNGRLGLLAYYSGKYRQAIGYYEKTSETGMLSKAYARDGKADKAIFVLTKDINNVNKRIEEMKKNDHIGTDDKIVLLSSYKERIAESEKQLQRLREYRPISTEQKDSVKVIIETLNLYREANNKFITGRKATTPNKKMLPFSREEIITSYNVSPDIYLAEQMYRDSASKMSSIKANGEISKARDLIIEAGNRAAEGAAISAKGYYIKAKDYSGEWERGHALKEAADLKIAEASEMLVPLVNKHYLDFSDGVVEQLKDDVKYYRKEK